MVPIFQEKSQTIKLENRIHLTVNNRYHQGKRMKKNVSSNLNKETSKYSY